MKECMNMHDKLVLELFNNKSVKALIYLIKHGRELEFKYADKICFISKDNSLKSVSIWIGKDEQAFDSVEELLKKMKINNDSFETIWNECELNVLY